MTQVRLTDLSNLLVAEYAYNGVGHVIRTDLPEPDMFTDLDGSTARTYDDLDRWNRVTGWAWTKDLTTDRDLYNVDVTYDSAGNITLIEDNVYPGWDASFGIDGLSRVKSVDRGTWGGSSISANTFGEVFDLDLMGNWQVHKLDLDGNGTYTGTGELNDDGTFNNANELTARDTDDDNTNDFTLTYDATGNLTDDGENYEYVYDAFGRLVTIKDQSSNTVAKYTYNGLGYRIGWHYDVDGDGTVENTSDDPWYRFVYDTRWRIVSTFRADDTSPKEVFVYHNAGNGGFGGASYIDAVVLRDKDANTAWATASDGTLEDRIYHLQNWRADVVNIVDENGKQLEAVRYDAYGVPYGIPGGDVTSDYKCDSSDLSVIISYGGAYDVRYDINLDGAIDSSDTSAIKFLTLGRGTLSEDPTASSGGGHGNRKGWSGHEHAGHAASLILSQHSSYFDASLGRHLRREVPLLNFYGGLAPVTLEAPEGSCFSEQGGGECFDCCDGRFNRDVAAAGCEARYEQALTSCQHNDPPPPPNTSCEAVARAARTTCEAPFQSQRVFCYLSCSWYPQPNQPPSGVRPCFGEERFPRVLPNPNVPDCGCPALQAAAEAQCRHCESQNQNRYPPLPAGYPDYLSDQCMQSAAALGARCRNQCDEINPPNTPEEEETGTEEQPTKEQPGPDKKGCLLLPSGCPYRQAPGDFE